MPAALIGSPPTVLRPGRARRARRHAARALAAVPVRLETPGARRRTAAERRTRAFAAAAVVTGVGAVALEVARVWRRGSAPLPSEADHVLDAGAEAVGETVAVAVAGYREGSVGETALLNLLLSFTGTWLVTRLSTSVIRRRGGFGPLRDVVVGDTHVHHFVPGIGMAFAAGGTAILAGAGGGGRRRLLGWLAVPYGAGLALTLDETALLLRLDDVYWSEEGVMSVHVTLISIALLSTALVTSRVVRRGEHVVLADADDDRPSDPDAPHLRVVA